MPTKQGWTVLVGAAAAVVVGRVFGIVEQQESIDKMAIRDILQTGRGRMPPFPHLSAADVDDAGRTAGMDGHT